MSRLPAAAVVTAVALLAACAGPDTTGPVVAPASTTSSQVGGADSATATSSSTPATTSTSTPATTSTVSPTTTSQPATTSTVEPAATSTSTVAPAGTEPDTGRRAENLRILIAEAAAFTQAEAALLLPLDLDPSAGGAPGYTRYVFRETSDGVVSTLVEGPLGPQTRCQEPELPCSYSDLVELLASGEPIPPELDLTPGQLTTLVSELDQLAGFAALHADVDTACTEGFISDAIQSSNMGSHFYRTDWFGEGFRPDRPEILLYAPSDGSLTTGPLGYCDADGWHGPDLVLVGTAFLVPPAVIGVEHPAAFTGNLDNWHSHFNICRGNASGTDSFVTMAECEAAGGNWHDAIGWMLHAWVAPGYDNQLGVFSMWNPTIAPTAEPSSIRDQKGVRGSDFPEGAHQSLIANFAFERVIRVAIGQGVYFNNSDSVPHTVSAGTEDDPDPDSFGSGLLNPGDNYLLDTSTAGTFNIYCALHPDMTATVIVG
jgi:plastocyanin